MGKQATITNRPSPPVNYELGDLYRCHVYGCNKRGEGTLHDDGDFLLHSCQEHGEAIAQEYREKLGEDWRFVPYITRAELYGTTEP